MDRTDTIISRLRQLMEQRGLSQGRFARLIGIDPSNLSKHLNGHLPVTDALVNKVVVELDVPKNWLLGETDVLSKPKSQAQGTPVYDIDVTAGFTEFSRLFTADRIVGHISLPQISPDSVVVRVSGDSMEPVINRDSLVAISRNDSRANVFWGQIYVVVMDDYRMVKFVRRDSSDESKLVLRSANSDYDDMIVDRRDVRGLYLVETVVNISRRY